MVVITNGKVDTKWVQDEWISYAVIQKKQCTCIYQLLDDKL